MVELYAGRCVPSDMTYEMLPGQVQYSLSFDDVFFLFLELFLIGSPQVNTYTANDKPGRDERESPQTEVQTR